MTEYSLTLSESSSIPTHKPYPPTQEAFLMESNGTTAPPTSSLDLRPVSPDETGEGFPYAPENFPREGDIWGWRVGHRFTPTGMFRDRYLYLPDRLTRAENAGSSSKQKHMFSSRLSLERYVKANFPEADIEAFFASFIWKIPAIPGAAAANGLPLAAGPLEQVALREETDTDAAKCKAGNKMCDSLVPEEVEKYYLPAMPCDICCTAPGFCRDCSCILCSEIVSSAYSGYSFIKCQANTGEGICGHVAHLECGLRTRLAGIGGRSTRLDAEYHCRRCDGRTDLISHVKKLLQTCEDVDLDDEILKKILNLGACLLRGSQKSDAKELLKHIILAISKLKCARNLEDVMKVDERLNTHCGGLSDHGNDEMEVKINGSPSAARTVKKSYDCLPPLVKLEIDVEQVLYDLKKSQELEYKIAEERLQEHKSYLQNLYQQVDYEKSELTVQDPYHSSALYDSIRQRKKKIKSEVRRFKEKKKIANGFGRTSKEILKEHFEMEAKD